MKGTGWWRRDVARVTGLALGLAASLGLNGYLVHVGHGYEQAAEAVRLDPAGLGVHAGARSRAPAEGPVLVFFGDSRAAMWPPPVGTAYHIENRGVGFQTTAQMLLRFDADVARLHPAVVVFEGGVNDLKAIADFPERRREIVTDCEANIEQIVKQCRRTGARVVLTTVFGIGDLALWRRPFWSRDVAAAVHEVNAFLPRLVGDGVVLFDVSAVLAGKGDGDGIQHGYQRDHLHLTPAGYAALNERLLPVLSLLPK